MKGAISLVNHIATREPLTGLNFEEVLHHSKLRQCVWHRLIEPNTASDQEFELALGLQLKWVKEGSQFDRGQHPNYRLGEA